MADNSQGVMVALRPIKTDWTEVELPHLTLVYAGQKADLRPSDFNALAKTTASLAMEFPIIQLFTKYMDVFGEPGNEVEVIVMQPTPMLMEMRNRVAGWNASTRVFNPHVTIGPKGTFRVGMKMPPAIAFDRIMLAWGEEELNFWLKPLT